MAATQTPDGETLADVNVIPLADLSLERGPDGDVR